MDISVDDQLQEAREMALLLRFHERYAAQLEERVAELEAENAALRAASPENEPTPQSADQQNP